MPFLLKPSLFIEVVNGDYIDAVFQDDGDITLNVNGVVIDIEQENTGNELSKKAVYYAFNKSSNGEPTVPDKLALAIQHKLHVMLEKTILAMRILEINLAISHDEKVTEYIFKFERPAIPEQDTFERLFATRLSQYVLMTALEDELQVAKEAFLSSLGCKVQCLKKPSLTEDPKEEKPSFLSNIGSYVLRFFRFSR